MENLPVSEYAFPGPLRDALVGAILDGSKTTTTSLLWEYDHVDDALPQVGDRAVVVDSDDLPVCIEEITDVRIGPLSSVTLAHAVGEGEGYESIEAWRAGHESFWHSDDYRQFAEDPDFTVNDDTQAVFVTFKMSAPACLAAHAGDAVARGR